MLKKWSKILGHVDRGAVTYVIWQNHKGEIFSKEVQSLAKEKEFLQCLSKKDAFLLGYLLGAEHEKFINQTP